jgi:hypothetical protein
MFIHSLAHAILCILYVYYINIHVIIYEAEKKGDKNKILKKFQHEE